MAELFLLFIFMAVGESFLGTVEAVIALPFNSEINIKLLLFSKSWIKMSPSWPTSHCHQVSWGQLLPPKLLGEAEMFLKSLMFQWPKVEARVQFWQSVLNVIKNIGHLATTKSTCKLML